MCERDSSRWSVEYDILSGVNALIAYRDYNHRRTPPYEFKCINLCAHNEN